MISTDLTCNHVDFVITHCSPFSGGVALVQQTMYTCRQKRRKEEEEEGKEGGRRERGKKEGITSADKCGEHKECPGIVALKGSPRDGPSGQPMCLPLC